MNLILFILLLFSEASLAISCPPGQYFVNSHFRSGYFRNGKYVSPTTVRAHCKTFTESYTFWNHLLSGKTPPGWPHKMESFKDWTPAERERFFEAIEALPKELWSGNIQGVYRGKKSKDFPNPATSADKIVVVYDSAFQKDYYLASVVGHELAHQTYNDLTAKERREYWFVTNWFPADPENNTFISRKDGFVQDDGRESPEEDFANNVESFLYEPEKLQKVTPHAYKWMKRHFGDKFKLGKGGGQL